MKLPKSTGVRGAVGLNDWNMPQGLELPDALTSDTLRRSDVG